MYLIPPGPAVLLKLEQLISYCSLPVIEKPVEYPEVEPGENTRSFLEEIISAIQGQFKTLIFSKKGNSQITSPSFDEALAFGKLKTLQRKEHLQTQRDENRKREAIRIEYLEEVKVILNFNKTILSLNKDLKDNLEINFREANFYQSEYKKNPKLKNLGLRITY